MDDSLSNKICRLHDELRALLDEDDKELERLGVSPVEKFEHRFLLYLRGTRVSWDYVPLSGVLMDEGILIADEPSLPLRLFLEKHPSDYRFVVNGVQISTGAYRWGAHEKVCFSGEVSDLVRFAHKYGLEVNLLVLKEQINRAKTVQEHYQSIVDKFEGDK